jgi:hypothetical protein
MNPQSPFQLIPHLERVLRRRPLCRCLHILLDLLQQISRNIRDQTSSSARSMTVFRRPALARVVLAPLRGRAHLRRESLKGVVVVCEGLPCQHHARPLQLPGLLVLIYLHPKIHTLQCNNASLTLNVTCLSHGHCACRNKLLAAVRYAGILLDKCCGMIAASRSPRNSTQSMQQDHLGLGLFR